ncbi:snaclec agglucetin subunit beta-2-like [Amphiura filiformis]|uniref:snaclec agglucetin subunit beta-2-like n=1 Tax=Amphiura filiformis TaxID=82378 RepID=UPI003B211B97
MALWNWSVFFAMILWRLFLSTNGHVTDKGDCKFLGANWIYWEQSCYHFVDEKLTWDNAISRCKELNSIANVVVVNNKEENAFVRSLQPSSEAMWLGCRDWKNNGYWTCVDDADSGSHYYVESNRTSAGFWYWDNYNEHDDATFQEPDGEDEDCLVSGITMATQFWHNWPCITKHTTTCEVPISHWHLVFVARSGVSIPDPYILWSSESFGSLNTDLPDAMELTGDFHGLYKSMLVSKWESLNITQARYCN